ncbi:MAG: hypothetical protein QOJ39_2839 [Candidatus Eremiobacteraeota bacterium]|jgi:hypothetical protein|nr:hypothetical protein [Candidatus Eremiobacteraeota bacterium]
MNNDGQLIKAALDRRFARAGMPPCPDAAWALSDVTAKRVTNARSTSGPRRFAYAAALLAVVAVAGLAAQASDPVKQGYMRFLFVSSRPLQPLIHAADRLSIAQAQARMPFQIVVPAGLPAGTRLQYAHVVSEKPVPRVALRYEAHLGGRYYAISINESTVALGPPVAHFEGRSLGHPSRKWTLPMYRWKHGDVVMELLAPELPAAMTDEIVRANTM